MTSTKYIGMDVHKESASIAVMNAVGKIVMECVIETKANMILQCIDGLRGDLHVTLEEGTSAAWLYDLLKPHVTELIVCDPRKNASMREDNQNDKIDARRLAELLRIDHLSPVYHGEHGLRTLKELVRSYLTVTKDQPSIEVGPFLVTARKSMPLAIVPSGWRRSRNPECAGGRSFITSNWMR
jgi:transposase